MANCCNVTFCLKNMKIELSTATLNAIDTHDAKIADAIPNWYKPYYHLEAGKEHYRLLMYFASLYNYEVLTDIGTNRGASAVALSINPTNMVYSIDIANVKEGERLPTNCEYVIGNILWDEKIMDRVLNSKFIMLDIDHEYHNEIQIYNRLVERGWKGIIVCDDIHLNDPMKRFWSEVSSPKLDITKYGHGSGTGVIILDDTQFELL